MVVSTMVTIINLPVLVALAWSPLPGVVRGFVVGNLNLHACRSRLAVPGRARPGVQFLSHQPLVIDRQGVAALRHRRRTVLAGERLYRKCPRAMREPVLLANNLTMDLEKGSRVPSGPRAPGRSHTKSNGASA